jgi:hypothetical protein
LSSSHGKHSRVRYRQPSKLTLTVACSTVLAAGAAAGGVALWPGAATAQSADRIQPAPATEAGLGQSLTDFEAQHAQAQASTSARQARLAAARARSAARARAARRAAQLAAERRAASATAAPTPAPTASSTPTPAPVTPSGTPQHIAMSLLGSYGWSSSQFSCLDDLWNAESGWNPTAENASGAYGIPQALPGSRMASAGPDWQSDATTQIKWGLGYIKGTYGSPCAAWGHEESDGWY